MSERKTDLLPIPMPVLALRGLVLFPKMVLNFDVGREKSIRALDAAMDRSRRIFLVAQHSVGENDPTPEDLYPIGVVAEVKQVVKVQGDNVRVLVEGLYRAKAEDYLTTEPFFSATVTELPLRSTKTTSADLFTAMMRTVKELFEEYCFLTTKLPRDFLVNAMVAEDPIYLAEYIAGNIPVKVPQKQSILAESSPIKRLQLLATMLESENAILGLEREIYDRVREQIDKNQREYYLREQMKAISQELGDDESEQNETQEYLEKIAAAGLAGEVKEKLTTEAHRLMKMPYNSHEAGVIRTYLDTCLELPWNKSSVDKIDIVKAQKLLDKEHYGLEKVKERILELLAVRKLAPDIKGQIVCLVGPPGVGKTSIAKSIAKSMGREYVRISLGGVRDESDIRGHRKTYIGAMPGRIINAIKLAGTNNPLMLLDEVDKLGSDYKGDPSSALLEVLDSEQNVAFRDHFIELPFDLSGVLFLATANTLDTIPAPLLDRMEVINLSSYTREEKFHIAKNHLLQKQIKRHGLDSKTVKITDDTLYALIDFYTREAGVRNLERSIGSLSRKAAKRIVAEEAKKVTITGQNIESFLGPKKYRPEEIGKQDEVGLVNGLAWTSVGGEMLQVEVAVLDGTGKIELTGSLGDVMKESAHAAVSYIRSVCDRYNIQRDFYKTKDLHIHFPEGAVPKDGPSAGVAICSALVSALTNTPARADVAMTGEITLRGRVLPIGGLKEKTMAAYRAGIKTVVIPKDNEPDLAEIDKTVRSALRFVTAEQVDTVLQVILPTPDGGKSEGQKPLDIPPSGKIPAAGVPIYQ